MNVQVIRSSKSIEEGETKEEEGDDEEEQKQPNQRHEEEEQVSESDELAQLFSEEDEVPNKKILFLFFIGYAFEQRSCKD